MLRAALRVSGMRALSECLKGKNKECASFIHTCSPQNAIPGKPKEMYTFPESHADFETSTAEWEYVERLMPMKLVPQPDFHPGAVAPSGWVAPSASKTDHPYFVNRNSNHLLRLYKDTILIKQEVRTRLKGIEGDVCGLTEELRTHLGIVFDNKRIRMQANELHGTIVIRGDYIEAVREFLLQKGF